MDYNKTTTEIAWNYRLVKVGAFIELREVHYNEIGDVVRIGYGSVEIFGIDPEAIEEQLKLMSEAVTKPVIEFYRGL